MGVAKPYIFTSIPETPEIGTPSGAQTPVPQRDPDYYVPKPKEYREGFLSSILKLYNQQGFKSVITHLPSSTEEIARRSFSSLQNVSLMRHNRAAEIADQTPAATPGSSRGGSGASTPKYKHQKWYYKNPQSQSTGALSDLVSSSTMMAQPGGSGPSSVVRPKPKYRPRSHQFLDTVTGKRAKAKKDDHDYQVKKHMAENSKSQKFLVKMCRALMSFGAPTHRLEGKL